MFYSSNTIYFMVILISDIILVKIVLVGLIFGLKLRPTSHKTKWNKSLLCLCSFYITPMKEINEDILYFLQ